jgi:hypothetical protein
MRLAASETDFTKVADSGAPFHAEGRRTSILAATIGIQGLP